MSRLVISKPIKYKRQFIAAGVEFECDEEHVDGMLKLGAHLVGGPAKGEPSPVTPEVQEVEEVEEPEEVEEDDTQDDEELPSYEALVARAEELGIEVGKKQAKTLLKLIRQAEAEE